MLIPIFHGGTGTPGGSSGDIQINVSGTSLGGISPGASGNVLISNGSSWVSAPFSFTTSGVVKAAGYIQTISTQTSSYVITIADSTILFDTTAGNLTATLPDATTMKGRLYHIKKISADANTVTVDTTSSQTIDGQLTQTISTQYTTISIISDGANWFVI